MSVIIKLSESLSRFFLTNDISSIASTINYLVVRYWDKAGNEFTLTNRKLSRFLSFNSTCAVFVFDILGSSTFLSGCFFEAASLMPLASGKISILNQL